MKKSLWIPGPTEVAPEILQAMGTRVIGHRSQAIKDLVGELKPGLRRLFGAQHVFFMTASATTVMEAGLRNLVGRRALVFSCGDFGQLWKKIADACGIAADLVEVPPGEAVTPELVTDRLAKADVDAVCLTHNETSTGVINPIVDLVAAVRRAGDASVLVDSVSALSAVELDCDALGADLVLAGVQKALALPPGLSLYALSERALAKAATVPHRGFVTDFLRNKDFMDKDQTPATPSVSHLFALRRQLERVLGEGLPVRAVRHQTMATMVEQWAGRTGHDMYARAGYRSPTVSALRSNRMPPADLLRGIEERCGAKLGSGYGDTKPTHFRIGHMGEHGPAALAEVLAAADATLEAAGK